MQSRTGNDLDESRHNVGTIAVAAEGILHPHQEPPRPEAALQGDSNNEWAEVGSAEGTGSNGNGLVVGVHSKRIANRHSRDATQESRQRMEGRSSKRRTSWYRNIRVQLASQIGRLRDGALYRKDRGRIKATRTDISLPENKNRSRDRHNRSQKNRNAKIRELGTSCYSMTERE